LAIYHFNPQQPIIYQENMAREFEGGGEELKMVSTYPLEYFGWKFWTIFQDVAFISEIFRLVEPKLSHHIYSDRNFRNIWVNGRQFTCPSYPFIPFFIVFFFLPFFLLIRTFLFNKENSNSDPENSS